MLYKLYVEYDSEIGDRDSPPDENDSWGFSHTIYSNHRLRVSKDDLKNFWKEDECELPESNIIYVLYALYSDGGTFGTTDGYFKLLGMFTSLEEAKKIEQEIRNNSSSYEYPWNGYFASLNSINLEAIIVT